MNFSLPLLILLWVAVMLSALVLVWVTNDVRRLNAEYIQLTQAENSLRLQFGQLLLEESALASHARLQELADEMLNLQAPVADQIRVITP